jgi:predicted nucleic acid-binding Zn ribbon protein
MSCIMDIIRWRHSVLCTESSKENNCIVYVNEKCQCILKMMNLRKPTQNIFFELFYILILKIKF